MLLFSYRAIDTEGKHVEGTIEAGSHAEALDKLRSSTDLRIIDGKVTLVHPDSEVGQRISRENSDDRAREIKFWVAGVAVFALMGWVSVNTKADPEDLLCPIVVIVLAFIFVRPKGWRD